MGKRALITGVSGQDGAYLAPLLVAKGYDVTDIIRRSSHPGVAERRRNWSGARDQIRLGNGDLLGNPAKAKANLGWSPDMDSGAMIVERVKADCARLSRRQPERVPV